ncbi:hypothetical protein BDW67DRAFT_193980 [Aspergillus spinulosporus]
MPQGSRPHRKARTGCFSCKKRRIKQKPTCRNCLQHKINCGYPETQVFRPPRAPVASQRQTVSPSGGRGPSANVQPRSLMREDMLNVRLMHHFTTSTCQTLATSRAVQALWRCQVPELGFVHHYLLQMIFAVAALHMSRKTPSEAATYTLYAYQQYEASLRDSSVALSQISSENCHALYAVSVLAFVFEFGTLQHRKSLLYNENGLLADWIVHSRGVHTIIGSSWEHLVSGCLKQMFECEYTSKVPTALGVLLKTFAAHTQSPPFPVGARRIYAQAVDELIKWSRLEGFGFYGWLCRYPDEFGGLLARKDPYALVIFGFSTVLLKEAEPKYWVDGRAPRLLSEIYSSLNTSLRVYLDWPMEILGLVT